jgi:hypothetical protein
MGEQVQRQRHGAVQGDQAGQLVATGDQHQAPGRAGQQRPHLLGVPGIVQDHQHPPAGQVGAVERDLLVWVRRNLPRGHPQCGQESAHRGHWGQRCAGGVEAAQIDVQLPIGEPAGVQVPPVQGQCGLADPGGTADRRDHHDRRTAHGFQLGAEAAYLRGAADEVHAGRRKLTWHDTRRGRGLPGGPGCRVGDRQGGIVGQDRLVQRAQLGTEVDAQFLGEDLAGPAVGVQRLGGPPGPVQGEHQLRPHPLPQRVFGGQRDQLGDPVPVPAEVHIQVDALFQGGQVLLDEPRYHLAVQYLAGHIRQRLPTRQPQRLIQQRRGRLRIAGQHGGPGGPHQGAEPVHVDRVGVHVKAISGRRADQRARLSIDLKAAAQP